ncbi:MAG: DUF2290 domain-containing protein [Nitrospirae bacterium]|nr:DUF2290 domain-containing protein [Nitrospirota bacterium]
MSYSNDNNYTNISWRQSYTTASKPNRFGTLEQYISIIQDRSYSCLLFDGSFLRISYSFKSTKLVSHSLWYYPCPFNIPYDDLLTDPVLDLIEMYVEQGFKYCHFKGPIRFDYDSERISTEFHPSTHVHFIDNNCRIPVKKPLSPGTFIKFIFRNFYLEYWKQYSFLKELHECFFDITILPQEEKCVHFSWLENNLGSQLLNMD